MDFFYPDVSLFSTTGEFVVFGSFCFGMILCIEIKGVVALLELKSPNFVGTIASALQLKPEQVRAAIRLLDEGNTIPFIARYRKELTGELDENQLREIAAVYESETNLYQRKCDVLRLLTEHGALEDEHTAVKLVNALQSAKTLTEVEDVYRPFRPKRKTRASIAKER